MDLQHKPVLGGTAQRTATRTAKKLSDFALKHVASLQCASHAGAYLDVGCGNGFITEHVAPHFAEVVGIDIEPERLREFADYVATDPKYAILKMSADRMAFPDAYFSFITSFEVLEHVTNLTATVREMVRVCRPGGVIVVSVPQVWFPFENHGMQVGHRVFAQKIPLLPYLRPLHRRFALARVFSSAELDRLFVTQGLQLLETAYATPQFERAASRPGSWESQVMFLRPMLDKCETLPVLQQLTGVSMLKAYRKPLRPSVPVS